LTDLIDLSSGEARAEVAMLGAELRGWSVGGTPLLWKHDPAVWAHTAPILFPVVGWTRGGRARVGGKTYPLGLHGFARAMAFKIARRAADGVALELNSSDETRALFPFEFALSVEYRLSGRTLAATLRVENRGAGPMPYACGLHPGFRWPFDGGDPSDYTVSFACAETPAVPEISADGLFLSTSRTIPLSGRRLPLTPDLFASEALCFLNARSRSLRFGREAGAALSIATEDFPHLALWSRPPAPFLCVESWTGHGDRDDFSGDLFEKDSMRVLPPGRGAMHTALYAFDPAP
jgi:galactose mutarotase-like enzyme